MKRSSGVRKPISTGRGTESWWSATGIPRIASRNQWTAACRSPGAPTRIGGEARLEDFDDREREDDDDGAPEPAGDSRAHAMSFGEPRRRPARSGRRLPRRAIAPAGPRRRSLRRPESRPGAGTRLPGSGLGGSAGGRRCGGGSSRGVRIPRSGIRMLFPHSGHVARFPASRASATRSTPQIRHAMRMFCVSGLRGFLGDMAILFTRAILRARARKSKCDRKAALRSRSFRHGSA